jgi:hypothetical protein
MLRLAEVEWSRMTGPRHDKVQVFAEASVDAQPLTVMKGCGVRCDNMNHEYEKTMQYVTLWFIALLIATSYKILQLDATLCIYPLRAIKPW